MFNWQTWLPDENTDYFAWFFVLTVVVTACIFLFMKVKMSRARFTVVAVIVGALVATGWVYQWAFSTTHEGVREIRVGALIVVCALNVLLWGILAASALIAEAVKEALRAHKK